MRTWIVAVVAALALATAGCAQSMGDGTMMDKKDGTMMEKKDGGMMEKK